MHDWTDGGPLLTARRTANAGAAAAPPPLGHRQRRCGVGLPAAAVPPGMDYHNAGERWRRNRALHNPRLYLFSAAWLSRSDGTPLFTSICALPFDSLKHAPWLYFCVAASRNSQDGSNSQPRLYRSRQLITCMTSATGEQSMRPDSVSSLSLRSMQLTCAA